MQNCEIYQIVYSPETKASIDPGFLELDNMANDRPDWREYWPIRKFLLERPVDPNRFYGFFSPKFHFKTGLMAAQVHEFVQANADADVIIFSPFPDQSAFFTNVFEQGEANHRGMMNLAQKVGQYCGLSADVNQLVMSTANTIYCNYFVARPAFWQRWIIECEKLFNLIEFGQGELADLLRGDTTHDNYMIPFKVMIIERMASLILAAEPHWRTRAHDPFTKPKARSAISHFDAQFPVLDALKQCYLQLRHPQYLEAFVRLRQSLIAQVRA